MAEKKNDISFIVENATVVTKKKLFSRKAKPAPGRIVQGISGKFQKYATIPTQD